MTVVRLGARVQTVSDLVPEDAPIWNADRIQGVHVDISGLSAGEWVVSNGTEFVVLPLGADKKLLVVDTADPSKIKWDFPDHGDSLSGLGDDDHTQYIRVDGTRAFTGDQSLGKNDLLQVNSVAFTTAGTAPTYAAGNVFWEPDDNTLSIQSGLDTTTLQVGQEEWIQVRNATGSPLPEKTVVMYSGTLGASGRIKAAPMVADGTEPAMKILGITTMAIPSGQDGMVTVFGKIRGVDTSTWADGDVLYADPATPGGLTSTTPSAPNLKLPIAVVIKAASNGTLFVRATSGSSLHDDHFVEVSSLAAGDLLQWKGTRWENVPAPQTSNLTVYSKSAAYTALGESQLILGDASGAAFDVDLPPAASAEGFSVRVKKVDASANAVTVVPDGAETIDGAGSYTLSSQYDVVTVVSDGTSWWIV